MLQYYTIIDSVYGLVYTACAHVTPLSVIPNNDILMS